MDWAARPARPANTRLEPLPLAGALALLRCGDPLAYP